MGLSGEKGKERNGQGKFGVAELSESGLSQRD